MALRKIHSENLRGMKVKVLPNYVKAMVSVNNMKQVVSRAMDNYHAKYIQTSSIDPLPHVCYGGMIFSYLVVLLEECRHLEHQRHTKEHGSH